MDNILSALEHLNCADLDHAGWITVGMALKAEGYDVSVWDKWSSLDASRYHPGECERRWRSFRGNSKPVTGASIVKLAMNRGWTPFSGDSGIMDWNDVIEYDGPKQTTMPAQTMKPSESLIRLLETLFAPTDYVGYVTEAWKSADGKWLPKKGVYNRTSGELIDSLRKHPEDLGATVGDWKPEAGAWIRFNALDGKGVKNENVTSFKYALVESDAMSIDEQIAMYKKLELPIAVLVHSGNKSVHAIVRVDAANDQEYRKRVSFLYEFLDTHGLKVDTQNKNPSRLSRMPGVTRNGRMQELLDVNIGRKSWEDWMKFVNCQSDDLPELTNLSDYLDHPPALPEPLIDQVLRRGHKMLISGSSKAGKSFLLMELCIAIAEGTKWLGFQCLQGNVLYVNLEIDKASCINRFLKIYQALKMRPQHVSCITIWNLRGHAVPLDQLVPKLIHRVKDMKLDAIIIDPIYKVITGDENKASDMAAFCNQFDKICTETGCSVIYCHHHSKGAQGLKKAMDRASGSGVFARDPDAQLDMIELELSDDIKNLVAERGATGWRLECSLREFENFKPIDFWFEYPIHRLDSNLYLNDMPTQGSAEAGRLKNSRAKSPEAAAEEFRNAFRMNNLEGTGVTVKDMATHLGLAERTIRERVKKLEGEFYLDGGTIYPMNYEPDLPG